MMNLSVDQYNEMKDIAESKDYFIEELLIKAEGNLVQDQLDENRRNDLEKQRYEEAQKKQIEEKAILEDQLKKREEEQKKILEIELKNRELVVQAAYKANEELGQKKIKGKNKKTKENDDDINDKESHGNDEEQLNRDQNRELDGIQDE